MSADTVTYLYAVARPLPETEITDLTGVYGSPVHLVNGAGLIAVVSAVPAEDFGEAPLRENLEDLAWLERIARAHNHVVDFLAHRTITMPFRLATIYRNDQRVREVLRERSTELTNALDRVTGRVEWGIKVLTVPAPPAAEPSSTAAPSGRSYLQQRLAQQRATDDALQRATADAEAIDSALAELAVARRRHRPQSRELSRASGENILNVSYLVPVDRSEDFRNRAADLDATTPGCRVELTGPWAPYSFALEETPATTREESPSHG